MGLLIFEALAKLIGCGGEVVLELGDRSEDCADIIRKCSWGGCSDGLVSDYFRWHKRLSEGTRGWCWWVRWEGRVSRWQLPGRSIQISGGGGSITSRTFHDEGGGGDDEEVDTEEACKIEVMDGAL